MERDGRGVWVSAFHAKVGAPCHRDPPWPRAGMVAFFTFYWTVCGWVPPGLTSPTPPPPPQEALVTRCGLTTPLARVNDCIVRVVGTQNKLRPIKPRAAKTHQASAFCSWRHASTEYNQST